MSDSKSKFSELNMTRDELERLTEAMKKEEFRKLLVEYAEEISDPKNREIYEKEISQLERERGMNVTFIHPEPGFCLKTTQNGQQKCFINICKNANVAKPTSSVETENNRSGLCWQIPHTCTPPREDTDKTAKNKCIVYDVVFHPDTYRMGETNQRFNKLIKDTALDTIEKNFKCKLDRVNVKVLKHLNFKGRPTATVIRKPEANTSHVKTDNPINDDTMPVEECDKKVDSIVDELKRQYLQDQLKNSVLKTKPNEVETKKQEEEKTSNTNSNYTTPNYSIVHRGQIGDMQDYANDINDFSVMSTRPKELTIRIDLPLCKSSQNVSLDIFERKLYLKSNDAPNYLLDLNLPYPINEKESKAKFDKSKRCLNVTLPVIPFVQKVTSNQLIEQVPAVDTLPISPPSSVSSSCSSLSNSSCYNFDTILNTEVASKETEISFVLPSQIQITQYKHAFTIKLNIPNYDQNTIKAEFKTDNSLNVKCESSSSGGYIQFYSAFCHFFSYESDESEQLPFNCFQHELQSDNPNSFRLTFLNQDSFEVSFNYKSKTNSRIKAFISTSQLNNNDLTNPKLIKCDVKQELNNELNSKRVNSNNNNNKKNNSNKKSNKDFIFQFQNFKDQSSDEDDDEGDDNLNKNESLLSKLAEAGKLREIKEKIKQKHKEDKIDEDDENEEEEEEDDDIEDDLEDCEKNYLASTSQDGQLDYHSVNESEKQDQESFNNLKDNFIQSSNNNAQKSKRDDNDTKPTINEANNNNNNTNSLSSSLTDSSNEATSLGSSLNGSSSFNKLKGILKKPRSFSESESGLITSASFASVATNAAAAAAVTLALDNSDSRKSFGSSVSSNSGSDETSDLHGSKKSVKFNNQVVRNVFKPGSTVIGMKKPNSAKNNKNKNKKNKRKRTVSDPSHDSKPSDDHDAEGLKDGQSSAFLLRARSISESSDDSSSALLTNSNESLNTNIKNNEKEQVFEKPTENENAAKSQNLNNSNKKKKKKSKGGKCKSNEKVDSTSGESKNPFDMETMLQWKNTGRLPEDDNKINKNNSEFKFQNKIMNDLDD